MAQTGLSIAIHNEHDGIDLAVVVGGVVNDTTAPTLTEKLLKIVRIRQPRVLHLDASAVEAAADLSRVRTTVEEALRDLGGELTFDPPAAEVAHDASRPRVILPPPEIDMAARSALGAQIFAIEPAQSIVFDLTGVRFCDCAGLSLFATAKAHTDGCGGDVVLRNPRAQVQRLLEAVGMHDAFTIERDPR